MSNNFQYTNGLGNVGSYQISSIPFLSSSLTIPASGSTAKIIEFPNVTRTIVITNTTNPTDPSRPFKFAFSAQGITGDIDNNYVVLDNGESFTGEFRVIKVFLVCFTQLPMYSLDLHFHRESERGDDSIRVFRYLL